MFGIFSKLCIVALASSVVTAVPVTNQKRACPSTSSIWDAQALLKVTPSAASCSNAAFQDECRTADQAAPFITKSFAKYSVTNVYEQAALVAVMALESGSFAYNKNHFPAPGRPGQGTRNMQSPAFNLKYAQAVIPSATLAPVANDPAAVLNMVNTDELSFASAAWFLTTQCTQAQRTGLQSGSIDGWHNYVQSCIGTENTSDRDAFWNLAIAQVKAKGSK